MVCNKCNLDKPTEDFIKNKAKKLGHISWCRSCNKEYWSAWRKRSKEQTLKYQSAYYLKNPSKRRAYRLNKNYKMSIFDYAKMAEDQDHKCLICKENKKLHVDHNHETGKVRGLLCTGCNTGLGSFQENIKSLRAAVDYLSKDYINE